MKNFTNFLRNRTQVKVVACILLFLIGFHFVFVGLFRLDLMLYVLSFGSLALYRVVATVVGFFILFVAYGLYRHNKLKVDESLSNVKQKIVKEAKEFREKL